MRPYSTDLRARVAATIDHHEGSLPQVARTFRVRRAFLVRLLQRRHAAGTLDPSPTGAARLRPWGRTTCNGSNT